MIEECNMRVIEWQPLGYQHLTKPDGKQIFQFRVYAELEKIGERMVKLAKKYFTDERSYLEK